MTPPITTLEAYNHFESHAFSKDRAIETSLIFDLYMIYKQRAQRNFLIERRGRDRECRVIPFPWKEMIKMFIPLTRSIAGHDRVGFFIGKETPKNNCPIYD